MIIQQLISDERLGTWIHIVAFLVCIKASSNDPKQNSLLDQIVSDHVSSWMTVPHPSLEMRNEANDAKSSKPNISMVG